MKSPEMTDCILDHLTGGLAFEATVDKAENSDNPNPALCMRIAIGGDTDVIHVTDENGKKFEITITEIGG